ncbi:BTAD domain-containing putative transcriptional regulator [Deinococcus altitudinis]|uniref:BTAD domain-containing putative transcriptional regulator n=1 Tax=Deinococcus altitudinis TaxID=468914 RepID=UPI003892B776
MPQHEGEQRGQEQHRQVTGPAGLTHRGLVSQGLDAQGLDTQEPDGQVLHIQVLGTPALSLNGRPAELSGKSLALVCYLALEGETRRAVLADLLWSGVPEDAGRRNLRRELHRLRATAVGDWLEAHGERLSLRPGYSLDLHEFHRLLQRGQSAGAAELLRGPLLDGLYPPSAEGFTEWREARSAELTEVQLSALSVWAAELGQEGRKAEAQEVCARMLRLDPLREQTHRQLMELLYQSGEQGAALARYRALESLLARELGVEPLPQTTLLYRQILEGAPSPGAAALPEQPDTSPLHLPLVGRAQALQTLARSRVVLVTGEAGVGKTRLIREFLGQAYSTVLQGSPEAALLPFAPIAALFVNRPGLLGQLEASARAAVGRLLPGLEPEAGGGPGSLPATAPVRTMPVSQQTLTLALTAALQTVVGQGVLVVEDLHWLDAPTLGVVTRLILGAQAEDGGATTHEASGREASGHVLPNRVLLSARPAELAARPELVAVLGNLDRQSRLTRLPLRELGGAEVERLIARLSGQEAPLFSRRLYQATAGHPLFLLETLRALRESGELHTEGGLWQTRYDQDTVDYAEIPIPQSVRAAVLLRVSRLGDAARRLLHAAAVAGEPFGASLHGVCGLSEWEALELLEAAEQAHLICPAETGAAGGTPETGQGGYRFGHDLYRHALLLDVTEARRRLIHRQLGRLLEAQGQFAPGQFAQGQLSSTQSSTSPQSPQAQAGHPARIASHFEQAGEWRSAWLHWQEAARRSAQVYDHAGALAHYARALHCLPQQGPEDLRHAYGLHLASSELLRHLGDEPGRLRALCQMRGLAHGLNDLGLRAEVAARLANYHTEHDDYGEAARTAQETLQDLGPHLDANQRSALMVEAGAALACMEDFAAAAAALTPALELVRGVNPARHANALYWLGYCAAQQQDWQGALEHYTRSVRELPPERPTRGRVLTLWKLGQVQARLGRASEAALTFRQADADALTLNATPLRALCLSDLGLLLLNSGEHPAAQRLLREAEACCGQDQEGLEAVATLREGLNAAQVVGGL